MPLNKLAQELSPYLLQHADNPVHWYPWGKEALNKAQEENKPILLSIGYAACHWCHVMAHESFEDAEIAEIMNQYFVNIKVDREERPDLDKIYQTSHHLLTRRGGGWPLTIFLDPDDLTPFFSGTYFPSTAKYQLPSFKELLLKIADVWRQQRDLIKTQNKELQLILNHQAKPKDDIYFDAQLIQRNVSTLKKIYDDVHGGFNGAPKFPQASKLLFLLKFEPMLAHHTLTQMALGGIADQLGGGFFRYAVDQAWQIPHFEKMLYDNGQLLSLYTFAYHQTQQMIYADVAKSIAEWALNTMQSPRHGFFSSIDADTDGHEGLTYLWDQDEFKQLLSAEEFAVSSIYFNLQDAPNFDNYYHLHIAKTIDAVAAQLDMPLQNAQEILLRSKQKLLSVRNKRPQPTIDKKILTAWNSLIAKGLIGASQILNEPKYLETSKEIINFLYKSYQQNHQLFSVHVEDNGKILAYLDDYIFLIDAILTKLAIDWETDQLFWSIELMEYVLDHFTDPDGGLFFTSDKHERVLYRPKSWMDEAIPAGNGIALQILLRMGHLLGETKYLDHAEKLLKAAIPFLQQSPSEHNQLLIGLHEFVEPSKIIIIRGEKDAMKPWQMLAHKQGLWSFAIPAGVQNLPKNLALRKATTSVCAYICEGQACTAKIEDINKFTSMIE